MRQDELWMGRIQEKILSQERNKITRKNKKASLRQAQERTETMENRKKTQDKNGESTNKILLRYFIYELYGSIIYSKVKFQTTTTKTISLPFFKLSNSH